MRAEKKSQFGGEQQVGSGRLCGNWSVLNMGRCKVKGRWRKRKWVQRGWQRLDY